ncbi:hypothetical protein ROHU_033356 [Labeo rohita]|uniref:Uncharacterized protein n=1 Tax=Labeo rohita TaxID=84645 RepID=A0A498LIL2_LABRO|nr:hypothetical protein ROHU_033356 [Labeo rohita]
MASFFATGAASETKAKLWVWFGWVGEERSDPGMWFSGARPGREHFAKLVMELTAKRLDDMNPFGRVPLLALVCSGRESRTVLSVDLTDVIKRHVKRALGVFGADLRRPLLVNSEFS